MKTSFCFFFYFLVFCFRFFSIIIVNLNLYFWPNIFLLSFYDSPFCWKQTNSSKFCLCRDNAFFFFFFSFSFLLFIFFFFSSYLTEFSSASLSLPPLHSFSSVITVFNKYLVDSFKLSITSRFWKTEEKI